MRSATNMSWLCLPAPGTSSQTGIALGPMAKSSCQIDAHRPKVENRTSIIATSGAAAGRVPEPSSRERHVTDSTASHLEAVG
jgi:hypothetical protein